MPSTRSATSILSASLAWFLLLSAQCSFLLPISGRPATASVSRHKLLPLRNSNATKGTRIQAVPLSVRLGIDRGQRSGQIVRNTGFEEDNTSAYGNSVPDCYPDYVAGDRIDPEDWALLKAPLQLRGVGRGQWKLVFPPQIKVWRAAQGKYKQVLSGVASSEVTLPQTIPLLIEGIQESPGSERFKLVAELTHSNSKKSVIDAVPLTVYSPGSLMVMELVSKANPAPTKPNPWSNWPPCGASDGARSEAQSQQSDTRRPPPARGNGLPLVAVTSPALGSVLQDLTAIGGTVKPAGKTSSIKRVEFSLAHYNPAAEKRRYWNGSHWITEPSIEPMLVAAYKNGSWLRQSNLPIGLNLASGSYDLEVKAYDNFDQWGYNYSSFVIDRDPKVAITSPAQKASIVALDTITGTVTAGAKGHTITEVKVRLSRSANFENTDEERGNQEEFWNGRKWVPEPCAPLTATYQKPKSGDAQGTWQLTMGLPPQAALTEGDYRIAVGTSDQMGNKGCAHSEFLVWRRPKLSVTSPSPEAKTPLTTLGSIEGTVELVPGGTPVTDVKVQLRRETEAFQSEYWNGTQWIKEPVTEPSTNPSVTPPEPLGVWLSARYEAPQSPATIGRWKVETGLPADAALPDGNFQLFVTASNNATLVADTWGAFRIYRGPSVTISWPKEGAVVTHLDAAHPVHGTFRLGVTGAPITAIQMSLLRGGVEGGYEVWNGTAWKPVPQDFSPLKAQWIPPTAPGGEGTWKRDYGWPPADAGKTWTYNLTVSVQDTDGRGSNTSISFRIKKKTQARRDNMTSVKSTR